MGFIILPFSFVAFIFLNIFLKNHVPSNVVISTLMLGPLFIIMSLGFAQRLSPSFREKSKSSTLIEILIMTLIAAMIATVLSQFVIRPK